MHILLVHNTLVPPTKYGGTERVVLWLAQQLLVLGHKVSLLAPKGSFIEGVSLIDYNPTVPLNTQIPTLIDVVHLHCGVNELPNKPFVSTMHGNLNQQIELHKNTIFVSQNHALRFGSKAFVYNGLNPLDYGKPHFNKQNYIHFLGDAAWRIKNVKAAIAIAKKANMPLKVLGGVRFNFNQGLRLTFNLNTKFYGMVGGQQKNNLLQASKAMIFPVRWHEPFGIAITESLYFGCPIFGTPYGSLPELINKEVGFLSNRTKELVEAVKHVNQFNPKVCHEYVMENFTNVQMASKYVQYYQQVLNGETINPSAPILNKVQKEKFLAFE